MMAVSHSKSSIASKPSRPATILAAFFASSHSYITIILYIHLAGLGNSYRVRFLHESLFKYNIGPRSQNSETLASDTTFDEDIETVSGKIHRLAKDKLTAPTKLRNRV